MLDYRLVRTRSVRHFRMMRRIVRLSSTMRRPTLPNVSHGIQSRGCLRDVYISMRGLKYSSILLLAFVGQADIVTVLVMVTVAGTVVDGFVVLVVGLAEVVAGLLELVGALLVEVPGLLDEEAALLIEVTALLVEAADLLVEAADLLVDVGVTAFDVEDVDVDTVTKISV